MSFQPALPTPEVLIRRGEGDVVSGAIIRVGNAYVPAPAQLDGVFIGRHDEGTGEPDQVVAVLRGARVLLATWVTPTGQSVDVAFVRAWAWTLIRFLVDPVSNENLENFPHVLHNPE